MSDAADWTLHLFGPLRLTKGDGTEFQFGARKEHHILALLAVGADRPHRRIDIVNEIWPNRDERRARRNFSYSLSVLRKELAEIGLPDAIHVSARSLQLNPALRTDVQQFHEHVLLGLRHEGPERVAHLERAIALHGEGLLPAMDAPWMREERARLERLYERCTEALSESLVPEGSLSGAIQDLPGSTWRRIIGEPTTDADAPPAPDTIEDIVSFVERAEDGLAGSDRSVWLDRVEGREQAILDAVERLTDQGRLRKAAELIGSLWRYWYYRGRPETGRDLAEQLLARRDLPTGAPRAKLLHATGTLSVRIGDLPHGHRRLMQALEDWKATDDDVGLLRSLANLGMVDVMLGDDEHADSIFKQALSLARQLDDVTSQVSLLLNRAQVALRDVRYDDAQSLLEERLTLVRVQEDRSAEVSTLNHLATVALHREQPPLAIPHAEAALGLSREIQDERGETLALRMLGQAALMEDRHPEALEWQREALDAAKRTGIAWEIGQAQYYSAETHAAAGDHEAARRLAENAIHNLEHAGDESLLGAVRALRDRVASGGSADNQP